jgi:predicted cupin superfamily sugar epimerase
MPVVTDWVASKIAQLALEPHPEGGFFREVYRSSLVLPLPRGTRNVLTTIHFVLPPGGVSRWHRVRADECWVWVDGDPVQLAALDDTGRSTLAVLGKAETQSYVSVVPAGLWQAARCTGPTGSHVVCTVSPGFDFADFTMATQDEMVRRYPGAATVIRAFA